MMNYSAIVEIEAVINSRPLSYIFSAEFEEPLTPHLVVGQRLYLPDHLRCMSDPQDEDFEINASLLTLPTSSTDFGRDGGLST